MIKLADILINDIKKRNAVSSKESIWVNVGFEAEYVDLKFRKLCNELVEKFEKFITIEELNEDKMLSANLLLNAVKKNKYSILAEKLIHKTSTLFDRIIDNSSDYYLQKYTYEKTLQNIKTNYEKKADIKSFLQKDSYENLYENLEIFFILERLRYSIDFITWSKQYKINLDIKLNFEDLESLISKKNLQRVPAVLMYYLIFQILTNEESQEKYFKLKTLAQKEIYKFPKNEQVEIFDALFSYCIKHVNKNNIPFLHEYLDLNDWGINEELTLKNGKLSPTSFRNYVVIGLRVGQFERVKEYIRNNINFLDQARQENALNFNLARVSFYEKKFESVLDHLNLVNYDDIWYNVNSKVLLLAAYYELDEFYVLEPTMDAFISFLRRDKVLDSDKNELYINFALYLKRLLKANTKDKLQMLYTKVSKEKTISNKPWLIEKIEELLKK